MRVLISGAGFTGKGAEAMLRTVQSELAKRLDDVEFFLWRCLASERRLALDAGFTPLFWPGELEGVAARAGSRLTPDFVYWSARELGWNSYASVSWRTHRRQQLLARAYCHYLDRVACPIDAVIDISGFAYGDDWGVQRASWNHPLLEYCKRHSVPTVYLPQAWGGFDNREVGDVSRQLLGRPACSSSHVIRSPLDTWSGSWGDQLGRSMLTLISHSPFGVGIESRASRSFA